MHELDEERRPDCIPQSPGPPRRRRGLGVIRLAATLIAAILPGLASAASVVVLDGAMHHLGKVGEAEWREFAGDDPDGTSLTIRFPGEVNDGEQTLLIRQRDVKLDREVRLNGKGVGRLVLNEADLIHAMAIPPGALRDGENVLEVGPAAGVDDVVVGEVGLDPRPLADVLGDATLDVQVREAGAAGGLPCRITIVDDRDVLTPLRPEPGPHLAARPGVVYTATGGARVGVRPGRYKVYATRGFEYGLAAEVVVLGRGDRKSVALAIRREVATPGLVACDTHVHTVTFSGHGDATLRERLVTLAGEGVELPVATDHDHLTDLSATARALGILDRMTPVIGDEVTTRRGHFNAFPFAAGEGIPDATIEDWPRLLSAIRAGGRDRVVVLNHPRGLHSGFRPFDAAGFNAATGEARSGVAFTFDAIEAINSGAMQSDPLRVVRDWFALWNHGQQVTAVGSSDSHDVSRFIVGQGRTYVACRDDVPGRIDVGDACRSLRDGRALVSLGLLARLRVADRFEAGDLATGLGDEVRVAVTVLGPSWTRADRVDLFANGTKIASREIVGDASARAGEKATVAWTIPRPRHDVALVAVASGPGVTAPYWPLARPYQPSSIDWTPRGLGITNPVRVDGDRDGDWSSPRNLAQRVIEFMGTEPATLIRALAPYDEAVATQAAALSLPATRGPRDPALAKALGSATEAVRRGFAAFEASLPDPGRE